jgi:UTP:GlnB (protein PII) uridylyltransferase
LHSIASGFTASSVSIHSARVDTRSGVAIDRFEISDVDGQKLDDDHKRAAVAAIHDGVHADVRTRRSWWSALGARS